MTLEFVGLWLICVLAGGLIGGLIGLGLATLVSSFWFGER